MTSPILVYRLLISTGHKVQLDFDLKAAVDETVTGSAVWLQSTFIVMVPCRIVCVFVYVPF